VDAKSYWLYTNDPFDNRKRREAFETYGFERGLEALAAGMSWKRISGDGSQQEVLAAT
jgi:hypothetical protein